MPFKNPPISIGPKEVSFRTADRLSANDNDCSRTKKRRAEACTENDKNIHDMRIGDTHGGGGSCRRLRFRHYKLGGSLSPTQLMDGKANSTLVQT